MLSTFIWFLAVGLVSLVIGGFIGVMISLYSNKIHIDSAREWCKWSSEPYRYEYDDTKYLTIVEDESTVRMCEKIIRQHDPNHLLSRLTKIAPPAESNKQKLVLLDPPATNM